MENFNAAFETFVAGCQKIVSENDKQYENVQFNSRIVVEPGRRYIRLVKTSDMGNRSAYCFVDTTNGNVLKTASWKTPAKQARGNIFDAHNGLAGMSPFGAHYLR